MKVVIQRVKEAAVMIDSTCVGEIKQGFLILLGIHHTDTLEDVDYLVQKISKLRVFEDQQGKMNATIKDSGGSILSVSQFTLYASTKKGNRPSFVEAARPEQTRPLYELFNKKIAEEQIPIQTGIFGATMDVSSVNEGPVTIIIDTVEKEKTVGQS